MHKLLCLFALITLCRSQTINVVQSAKSTNDRLTPQANLQFSTTNMNLPTVAIDRTTTYQEILGFGGAFTESAAYVYSQLNEQNQQAVLEAYWGDNGIHYTVGRVHMDSCDFSLASYNFDNVTDDFELENFDISHDLIWHIPFIKDAIDMSALHINLFLTPWSPPGWMKTNGQMDGSDYPGLINDTRVYKSWALYYSKFMQAYSDYGIEFWGLTVQNEPEFAAPWEACCYNPEEQRDFIKNYLGPQMQQDFPEVNIMIYDHNKDHIVDWVSTIYADPEAAQYVSGCAFHWYTGPQFENVEKAHQLYPDKFLLATEACDCPVSIGDWAGGEGYGNDILGDLNAWTVGWTDWNLLLDINGGPNHLNNFCNAPIIADTDNQVLYFNPSYYYMGQFSKFIPGGSVRIDSTGPSNLNATAVYTPTGQTVVVVMNQNDVPETFQLNDGGLFASYTIPEHGIVTFSW